MKKRKRRILAAAAALAMMGMQLTSLPPGALPEIVPVQEMTVHAADPVLTTNTQYALYLQNNFKYSYENVDGMGCAGVPGQ